MRVSGIARRLGMDNNPLRRLTDTYAARLADRRGDGVGRSIGAELLEDVGGVRAEDRLGGVARVGVPELDSGGLGLGVLR